MMIVLVYGIFKFFIENYIIIVLGPLQLLVYV